MTRVVMILVPILFFPVQRDDITVRIPVYTVYRQSNHQGRHSGFFGRVWRKGCVLHTNPGLTPATELSDAPSEKDWNP